jgi:aminopeptidase N
MIRTVSILVVGTVFLAACSGTATTDTGPPVIVATTTSGAPGTTEPGTTVALRPATDISTRLGLGDSRYPELGNGGYDAAHYTIDLSLAPDTADITALVSMVATATEDLDALSLDFIGYDITEVTVNGSPADYSREDAKLIIATPERIMAGSEFTTAVAYRGSPEPIPSAALPFDVGWRTAPDGVSYVASEPDGARSWIPVNDHPSDKATYTFRITVPDPLVAAANGSLVTEITDLGFSTWTWEMDQPMASYLATVVIGPLQILPGGTTTSGVALRNVLPLDLADAPPAALARQGDMIDYLSTLFGPYPFDTYGIAVVPDFDSALENQTLSIFGRWIVDSAGFLETVLVHELAHQWFGDSVSPADWGDIWLNEGFATYAEWLWLEHTAGRAAYDATVAGARAELVGAHVNPPGNPPANDLFNNGVYVWGGLVLAALRATVGDDAFFSILARYYEDHAGSVATTADFIALAEDLSGRDLTGFFTEWLDAATVPALPG